MLEPKQGGKPSGEGQDPDGVRVVAGDAAGRRRRLLFQGLALFFAASCAGYVLMPRRSAAPPQVREPGRPVQGGSATEPATSPGTAQVAAGTRKDDAPPPVSTRSATPRRMATQRAEKLPDDLTPEQKAIAEKMKAEGRTELGAGEYIRALNDAGIREGIGAFNPPGTKPPLEGVAVPEDLELPEGYVRHYQTTDDGQDIEPILMYSPDYEFLDENGQPIPIPEDRVVPADRVPPGFPVRPIEIPQRREEGDGR